MWRLLKHLRRRTGMQTPEKKIDISSEIDGFFGQHRSGWPYVLRLLHTLHNPQGICLDSFIERTFCWHPQGPRAHTRPWIGFIHVPPHVPAWFQHEQANDTIFATPLWQESLPWCRGLFTLSRYHRENLEKKLRVPIHNLIFPTEAAEITWSWARFAANPERKVVQIGWWLRRLHSIYMLPTRSYRKVFLRISHADIDGLLRRERETFTTADRFDEGMYSSAVSMDFLSDPEYDRLLTENLVFIHLYDSSANNTVIECIARRTPLLVNPIPAVVEYLGADYPLYFHTLEEAAAKAEDLDLVRRAHEYLASWPLQEALSGEHFLREFTASPIYQAIRP